MKEGTLPEEHLSSTLGTHSAGSDTTTAPGLTDSPEQAMACASRVRACSVSRSLFQIRGHGEMAS